MNKTEALSHAVPQTKYEELIFTIKFSLPAIDGFRTLSAEVYSYFSKKKRNRITSNENTTTGSSSLSICTLDNLWNSPNHNETYKKSKEKTTPLI